VPTSAGLFLVHFYDLLEGIGYAVEEMHVCLRWRNLRSAWAESLRLREYGEGQTSYLGSSIVCVTSRVMEDY
jgi:hypothetical protein